MDDNATQQVVDNTNEPKDIDDTSTTAQPAEPNGEVEEWKARAREWEKRSKANKEAADKLDEAVKAKGEAESKLADTEKQLAEMQAQMERERNLAAVAEAKGVPMSLLVGDTKEEMEACADRLLEFAAQSTPKVPVDKGGAKPGSTVHIDPRTIKDPVERLHVRAELERANNH